MTGIWKSNDGGTYYMLHIQCSGRTPTVSPCSADELWWIGMSAGNDGRTYTNMFKGTINKGTNPYTITGEWHDMPRGTNRNHGTLTLSMASDHETLMKTGQTLLANVGEFKPRLWEKVGFWSTQPPPPVKPAQPLGTTKVPCTQYNYFAGRC